MVVGTGANRAALAVLGRQAVVQTGVTGHGQLPVHVTYAGTVQVNQLAVRHAVGDHEDRHEDQTGQGLRQTSLVQGQGHGEGAVSGQLPAVSGLGPGAVVLTNPSVPLGV